jgi:tetratricopeptide (TPR) repeat protein
MQEPEQSPRGFTLSTLPWVVFGLAVLVYAVTLNRWVTLASLPTVAEVTGWNWWSPTLQAPFLYLVTLSVRWLPVSIQPLALNVFSVLCAAGALGFLARSIALLPHDRTREQRQHERSEFSLLSIRTAWLPLVLGALVCGLQRTFWENAVAATGESLNLLLFAYLIRCLLEYRLDGRESWLLRFTLVYGVATANNWAMIGFFPIFLAAVVWIVGLQLFEFRLLSRIVGCGLLGLLVYLVLPLMDAGFGKSGLGFWPTLKYAWVYQRNYLLSVPRSHVLLCSLTSILPVFVMGIRWPTSFGDVSVVGAALTTVMFRIVHLMFLAVCLWVAFDPPFSPRALGAGFPLLTLYYLGALSVGYFSGYFLLVFREPDGKSRHRASDARRVVNVVVQAAVWIACIAVPVGLVYKNQAAIRENNGPELADLASTLARSLPARGGIVLSDDPLSLLLVQAAAVQSGTPDKQVLLDTRSLKYRVYHQRLANRYPGRWPQALGGTNMPGIIDSADLARTIAFQARSNAVFYLHPSFGYYFELVYPEPHGPVYQLRPYSAGQAGPAPLTPELIRENQAFWDQAGPRLVGLASLIKQEAPDPGVSGARFAGYFYSRALDFWGVELQRAGRIKEAGKVFDDALALNPKNVAAEVNREFNRRLASGQTRGVEVNKSVEERLLQYNSWDAVLQDTGPFDDANFCYVVGKEMARNGLARQAAESFRRAVDLNPDNLNARFEQATASLQSGMPDGVLKVVGDIRAYARVRPLNSTNEVDLACLEASAYYFKTNYARAETVLHRALALFPEDGKILDMLSQMYLFLGRYQEALAVLDRRLKGAPDNVGVLLARSVVLIQSGAYAQALAPLNRVLVVATKNTEPYIAALLNRAIANLQTDQLDAAQRDYEALSKLIPNSYRVYYGLAEIAYRKKDVAAAKRYSTLYLRYVPAAVTPEQIKERKHVADRLKELSGAGR